MTAALLEQTAHPDRKYRDEVFAKLAGLPGGRKALAKPLKEAETADEAWSLARVVAPFVAPQVLDTYRINMASAWNLVIVAELVAATEGLGKRISLAQRFLRTDDIFVGLIVIGLVGLVIDLGFRFLMRKACSWAN